MSAKQKEARAHVAAIEVWGYKSIGERQRVRLAPLTVLAGANSSGKSSLMQPILLMKQTLEVGYDPGVLLLDGSHVHNSSVDQLYSKTGGKSQGEEFGIALESSNGDCLELHFGRHGSKSLDIRKMRSRAGKEEVTLTPEMTSAEVLKAVPSSAEILKSLGHQFKEPLELAVRRDRFMLTPVIQRQGEPNLMPFLRGFYGFPQRQSAESFIRGLVHLPGLRGNPARSYPVTAIGNTFPGTFDIYTASMISQWQDHKNTDKLSGLAHDMVLLGLTWKVKAQPINDTQVELLVGRLPKSIRGGANDLVSIADVGFGVSQTLPVLVALHAATEGQTVYLEQPEIHLHPRAQLALAKVLASAVKRGVRVIVETHSSVLLLGLQTLVAKDEMQPTDIALHWFMRDPNTGWTKIETAEMDETGAFGDWPVDFADVSMGAEDAYLSAADEKLLRSH